MDTRKKGLPPSLVSNKKILWNWSLGDLIVLAVFIVLGFAIGLGTTISYNNPLYFLFIAIPLFLIGFGLTLKIDISVWKWIYLFVVFSTGQKTATASKIKPSQNLSEFNGLNSTKTFCYKVKGININNFNENQLIMLENALTNAFNSNLEITIYKLDIPYDLNSHKAYLNNLSNSELKQTYFDYLNNKAMSLTINEQFIVVKNINEFNLTLLEEFKQVLASYHIQVEELNEYERSFILDKIFFNKNENWKANFTYLSSNNCYLSFLKINALPEMLTANWLADLLSLDGVDFKMGISAMPSKMAERKINQAMLSINNKLNNPRLRPQKAQRLINQQEATNELNNDFVSEQQTINLFDLLIKIETNDLKQLIQKRREVIRLFSRNKYECFILYGQQLKAFGEFLPVYETKLKEKPFNLSSSDIAFGHPFTNGNCIETNGWYLGYDENNFPVFLNFNQTTPEKENNNLVILGASGSGKQRH